MEPYGVVYKITNLLNGNLYVGLTTRTIKKRFYAHIYHATKEHRNNYLHCAIRKYGVENFKIEEIVSCFDQKSLCELECYFIKKYNTLAPNGYNLTTGGEHHKLSPEALKRHSEIRMGKKRGKYSEEHCKKISEALKGRKLDPEHARKSSLGLKNWIRDNGHPQLGRKKPQEEIDKIREKKTKYRNIEMSTVDGVLIATFFTVQDIADHFNWRCTSITKVLAGSRNSLFGYKFECKLNKKEYLCRSL